MGLLETGLGLRCLDVVSGVLESEVMSRSLVPVLGSSNPNLTGSGVDLRGLEGKIRALLVELSLVKPVGKGGTSKGESRARSSSVEGTLAKLEVSLRTIDAERRLRFLNLVSDSSSSVGERTGETSVATSETSSSEARAGTISGNRSASYGRGVSSSSKEASSACSEGTAAETEASSESSSETTSAAIATE